MILARDERSACRLSSRCAVVVPLMFAVGYALQSVLLNRALGRNILPPLLVTFGLSIIVQNGLLETFSADTRRLDVGRAAKRVDAARRRHRDRGHAADLPRVGDRGDLAAQRRVLSHRRRPRVPRHLRRCRDRAAHGHQQSLDLRDGHGDFARRLRAGGILPRHARQFRSQRSDRRGCSTPSRRSSSAASAACGARLPAASSSASRRRSARTSIPNGRFSPATSRSWSCW